MNIRIVCGNEVLGYAAEEVRTLLGRFTNAGFAENGEKSVCLRTDPDMGESCYSLCGNGCSLTVSGGSPSAVLCGVYEAFTDAGLFFEPNGVHAPVGFDTDGFFTLNKTVRPKVRLRGIRQHINFPMDISSYTLKDAKEYIRNIARMRYNAITFHSYNGQWHVSDPENKDEYSGHFFYGQYHPVPSDPETAKHINNRKTFCIPEIEPVFDDNAKRQEMAEYWLREVISEAKKAYMTVTYSVELHSDSVDSSVRMIRNILELYPQTDVLEMMSIECSWGDGLDIITESNVISKTVEMFGEQVLNSEGSVDGYEGGCPHDYGGALIALRRGLDVYGRKDEIFAGLEKVPELRIGMYQEDTETLKMILSVMRKAVPEDVQMSFLPNHGAMAVADNVSLMGLTKEDLQKTMLYTWAEFDGSMYLQQLSVDGAEKLISLLPEGEVYGVCVNHWRTSENMLCLVYDSMALTESLSVKDFYDRIADVFGVGKKALWAKTLDCIAKADTLARDTLGNVGFCYVGCWFRRENGITQPTSYLPPALNKAADLYIGAVDGFRELLPETEAGIGAEFIRFMINRCTASVLHLYSMNEIAKIRDLMIRLTRFIIENGKMPDISAEENTLIRNAYANMIYYADKYVSLYCEMLPDRGCEGNVVSYLETVHVYAKSLFKPFIDDIESITERETYDAPPLPIAI